METRTSNLPSKISTISLIGSLSLLIFGFVSAIFSLIFSFSVFQLGFKDDFLNLPWIQNLSLGIILIMVIMAFSLFYAKKWLHPRMEEVKESVGVNLLTVLSIILSIILLLLFYFGYANFLSFLFTRFWS
jgi:amino acid transporter